MGRIVTLGLVHLEASARVDAFPLEYSPLTYSPFSVQLEPSGTGFIVSRALSLIGEEVRFLSFIGRDSLASVVRDALDDAGLSSRYLLQTLDRTMLSIALRDGDGRTNHTVDASGFQSLVYPSEALVEAARGCDLCVICDSGLARHVHHDVRMAGLPVALFLDPIAARSTNPESDVMRASDIVFAVGLGLESTPEQWLRDFRDRPGPEVVVVSLGARGALVWVRSDNFIERMAAAPSTATEGAIDNEVDLFASFVQGLVSMRNPYDSLERALDRKRPEHGEDVGGSEGVALNVHGGTTS